jgi:hypothetical protein
VWASHVLVVPLGWLGVPGSSARRSTGLLGRFLGPLRLRRWLVWVWLRTEGVAAQLVEPCLRRPRGAPPPPARRSSRPRMQFFVPLPRRRGRPSTPPKCPTPDARELQASCNQRASNQLAPRSALDSQHSPAKRPPYHQSKQTASNLIATRQHEPRRPTITTATATSCTRPPTSWSPEITTAHTPPPITPNPHQRSPPRHPERPKTPPPALTPQNATKGRETATQPRTQQTGPQVPQTEDTRAGQDAASQARAGLS